MPGDLNLKKSWNPALMKNQKKIWEREQDALKEHQAIKQRTKEIALEREKEEMIRLQYGDDLSNLPQKQKLELSKLGWMYTDMPKDSDDDNGFKEVEEDFLENTAQVEQLLQGNKPALQSMASRFDKVASVGAGRASTSLNDDPLLQIKKQQRVVQRAKRDVSPERSRHSRDNNGHHKRGSYSRSEKRHRESRSSQLRELESDRHRSSGRGSSHRHKDGHSRSERNGYDRHRSERSHSSRLGHHRHKSETKEVGSSGSGSHESRDSDKSRETSFP